MSTAGETMITVRKLSVIGMMIVAITLAACTSSTTPTSPTTTTLRSTTTVPAQEQVAVWYAHYRSQAFPSDIKSDFQHIAAELPIALRDQYLNNMQGYCYQFYNDLSADLDRASLLAIPDASDDATWKASIRRLLGGANGCLEATNSTNVRALKRSVADMKVALVTYGEFVTKISNA